LLHERGEIAAKLEVEAREVGEAHLRAARLLARVAVEEALDPGRLGGRHRQPRRGGRPRYKTAETGVEILTSAGALRREAGPEPTGRKDEGSYGMPVSVGLESGHSGKAARDRPFSRSVCPRPRGPHALRREGSSRLQAIRNPCALRAEDVPPTRQAIMQPQTQTTFQSFGLRPTTMAALAKKGYKQPTPIQELAIPILLQGDDIIGQAQTGTGKTAAFGLPIVEDTRPGRVIQTLILAPTRELANQIVGELAWMAHGTPFKATAIYGGVGFGNQISSLRRGDLTCVVACPGRLLDLLQRREIDLRHVRHVVLDEADRMLDMGFIRDIEKIFQHLPRDRQTMLFSATMPPEVRKLAERYLRTPEFVRAESGPTAT